MARPPCFDNPGTAGSLDEYRSDWWRVRIMYGIAVVAIVVMVLR